MNQGASRAITFRFCSLCERMEMGGIIIMSNGNTMTSIVEKMHIGADYANHCDTTLPLALPSPPLIVINAP